jgi:DNA-binding cell septation regulator SpoVG
MEIIIEHQQGKYPSFNVALASVPGAEPFLVVKGCRIVDGTNGPFVSGPATKNATSGKYWNHTYFGEKFAAAVLAKATQGTAPQAPKPSHDAVRARQLPPQRGNSGGFEDMDSDIPFANAMRGVRFMVL